MDDRRGKPVVLLVDDDTERRLIDRAEIASWGYPTEVANTFEGAMAVLEDHDQIGILVHTRMADREVPRSILSYVEKRASERVAALAWADTSLGQNRTVLVELTPEEASSPETISKLINERLNDEAHAWGALRFYRREEISVAVFGRELGKLLNIIRRGVQDNLTGLPNLGGIRNAVVLRLNSMKSRPADSPVACGVFVDADDFKQINEIYGHPVGDDAINHLASCLHGAIRLGDLLGRKGGDEFFMFFPDTEENDAQAIVEHIRQRVMATPFLLPDGTSKHFTLACGISEILATDISDPGKTYGWLLKEANDKQRLDKEEKLKAAREEAAKRFT